MKQRLLGALIGMTLLLTLTVPVLAVDEESISPNATSTHYATTLLAASTHTDLSAIPMEELEEIIVSPDITVNGDSIIAAANATIIEDTTYVSIRTMIETLYPECAIQFSNQQLTATGPGFTLTARPGDPYFVINGRYLYVPNGILYQGDTTMAPIRTLAYALGASTQWNAMTHDITVTETAAPLMSGDSYYDADSLYWLSRVINAESGNQPLEGKIAVGTVILNRLESPKFPNTIKSVIFDRSGGSYQFSVVPNGSIYRQPNASSVIAAKLCMDGAREAGDSLFFHVKGLNSWASRNKTYVTTIANHEFFR